MSFSRLLLVAANSKKYIPGKGNDKVCISSIEGEVILCFQLDDQEKRVARSLGMPEAIKRCDGLVFYSQDGKTDRVICLVEMKSTNVEGADEQLISTKKYITELLLKECNSLPESCHPDCKKQITHIIWKACLYHYGSSPNKKIADIERKLKDNGFKNVNSLTIAEHDLRPLLRGEGISAKEKKKKF